jgi:glycerol-3-phosphate acyltransferase PlsY
MEETLAIVIGYFIGSIPFAFLVARWHGIDLRVAGSGNVGATNVLRTGGVSAGIVVLLLDGLKGALAVMVAQRLTTGSVTPVAAGLASVVGHIFPVWLRFRGGRGVATAAGTFAVLAPFAVAAAAVIFTVVVWVTRFVSLGSVSAATILPVISALTEVSVVTVGAVVTAVLIVFRHRDNLQRVMAGTERRVGLRVHERAGGQERT